ncbi:DUF2156 domain-containing protein [Plantibacter flavus]|uniref:bifunctional lysylphosphatidylglycerol flippase/synthetase MprF n=1 Tax=Plantibacter flavus TaxID=150123 RepID=UPI003F151593
MAPPRETRVRFLHVVRRLPATLALIALVLVLGVVSQGLWRPLADGPWHDWVAYGLPAFEQGRFWTAITGTFFFSQPWFYALIPVGFLGMAYLEFKRGTRAALAYFWFGQLLAVFAASLIFWLLSMTGWPWARMLAGLLDAGPGSGLMACMIAALTLIPAPWRVRGLFVLLTGLLVATLFGGRLADVEHLIAAVAVLVVDKPLRFRRTTVREKRLIAFVGLLALGAITVLVALVPTNGPFGRTEPLSGSFADVAFDVVVILLIANGLRRSRRLAWLIAILLGVVNLLTAALVLLLVAVGDQDEVTVDIGGDPSTEVATALLWVAMMVYLIVTRNAFRWRRKSKVGIAPTPTVDDVKDELRAFGGGTLSWMTTWEGQHYARTSTGVIAYQVHAGVAIALADPIGPESGRAQAVAEFSTMVEEAGLIPCFFSSQESTRAAVPDSWRNLIVADDTIVDLPGLEFVGKRWNSVRTAINRAARDDVTFRMTTLADESWGVKAQLRGISDMWVGDKSLPEMGFTLGTLDQALDPEVRVALAVSSNGDVDGFLSWLPVYGEGSVRGWTLDLMRRRDGGFPPVMEFLLGSSALHFRDEGAQFMSLSGAPLAHEYPPDAGPIAVLSEKLADTLEPVYGFQSLHRFKEKFHPRYETLYLLFRDESDLTRIAAALTRAFLPGATLRQFAGAGLELVRGKD